MARTRLIPGYDIAPGPNRVMVQDDSCTGIIYPPHCLCPDEAIVSIAEENLAVKQKAAELLGSVCIATPADVDGYTDARTGWNALTTNIKVLLDKCITDDHTPESWPGFQSGDNVRKSYLKAAGDGAATDIAYLEVLSKVLLNHDFDYPNKRIAQWARKSVGFIIEWSGLHKQADIDLAWGLSYRRRRGPKGPFEDLHFNPRWFIAYDTIEQVGVNPVLVPNVKRAIHLYRIAQGRVDPHLAYLSPNPLFACPGAKLVPRIHEAAVDAAESAELFERTWLEERANHGYPEARVVLEGLANARQG